MSQLQVKQIAAPNFSASNNLAIESAKTLDRGFNTATSILKDLDTGQKEKNDIALAGEIAQLGSEEDLASFLDTGSFDGKNLSVGMTKRIAELRGTVLGFEQDRANIDLTGAQANSARASAASTLAASGRADASEGRTALEFQQGQDATKQAQQRQRLVAAVRQDNLANGVTNLDGSPRVSSFQTALNDFDTTVSNLTQKQLDNFGQSGAPLTASGATGDASVKAVNQHNIDQGTNDFIRSITANNTILTQTQVSDFIANRDTTGLTSAQITTENQKIADAFANPDSELYKRLNPGLTDVDDIDITAAINNSNAALAKVEEASPFSRAVIGAQNAESDPTGYLAAALQGTQAGKLSGNELTAAIKKVAEDNSTTLAKAAEVIRISSLEDDGYFFGKNGALAFGDGIAQNNTNEVFNRFFEETVYNRTLEKTQINKNKLKQRNRQLDSFTKVAKERQKIKRNPNAKVPEALEKKYQKELKALRNIITPEHIQDLSRQNNPTTSGGSKRVPIRPSDADNLLPTAASEATRLLDGAASTQSNSNTRQLGTQGTDAGNSIRSFFEKLGITR